MMKGIIKKILRILSFIITYYFNKICLIDKYINFLYKYEDKIVIRSLIYFLKIDLKNMKSDIKSKYLYKIINYNESEKYIKEKLTTKNILITPEVIGFVKKSHIEFKEVVLNIYNFENAIITYKSDIIRFTNECYWYKFHKHFMYKTIPLDNDLITLKNNNLILRNTKKLIVEDKVISLVGAVDNSWSHFIVQYLPKLVILKDYYFDKNITVAISLNIDKNCRELVEFIIPKTWKIFEIDENILLEAKELIYVDNTSWITDHSNTLILGDIMIYEIALKILKEVITKYKESKSLNIIVSKKKKYIYLRRVSNVRTLLNYKEVDKLLERYNFEIIYPHLYSLEEKIKIFSEAEIIIGPLSSGFVNIIFCNKDTKVICFLNKNRVWDTYISTIAEYFGMNNCKYLLSNYTQNTEDPHSSYTVDIKILENEIKNNLNIEGL